MMKYRYYRTQLTPAEKEIYDKAVHAMENCKDEIMIPYIKPEEVRRILTAVDLDQPQLFYVRFHEILFGYIGSRSLLNFFYGNKGSVLEAKRKKIREAAALILKEMHQAYPQDPFLFLHDHLVRNTVYGEKEGREDDAHSIYGALIDHECVCEGYAKAYKYLCALSSLQCMVVTGRADVPHETPGAHAWNMICENGHLFHVDVTFDHLIKGKYCSRSYYRLNEKQILNDHSFDPLFRIPYSSQNGTPLKTVGSTAQLIEFLKQESRSGKPMSQIRLTKGFTMDEIIQKVESGLRAADYAWYQKLDSYYYRDDAHTISFIWKTAK